MNEYIAKFVSFNCKGLKRSFDCVGALCKSADLVALQETWMLQHEIPTLAQINSEFGYTGKSSVDLSTGILRGRPYGGVAILWRKSVFSSVSVVQCNSNRVTAIKIDTLRGKILIFNVYMPTDSIDNLIEFCECLCEINAVIETQDIEFVYVLGDFNAHPGELFWKELDNFCKDRKWICADIVKLGANSNSFTFVSDAHGSRRWLDHCLVTEAAWISVCDVMVRHDVYWSDHFPLEVSCNLNVNSPKIVNTKIESKHYGVIWADRNASQKDRYNKLCHTKLKKIDFPAALSKCCDKMCMNIDHRILINNFYNEIINSLSGAAVDSHESRRGGKDRHVTGWNKYVREAHREARLRFHTWKVQGMPQSGAVFEAMIKSKNNFKRKLKYCHSHKNQIQMDILAEHHRNKNFSKFWSHTNKMDPRPGLPVSVDGEFEPQRIANIFKDHFRVQSMMQSTSTATSIGSHVSETPIGFTAKDVKCVLKSLSKGKSPGHDGLSVEHLLHAGPHICRVLAMLYTFCMRHSYLPPELMDTVVVPVVKNKTGDVADKSNYRPISLATIVGKVLDGLLERQLSQYVRLNDAQFGFTSGLSTESAILALKQTVRYYTDRKTPVYAVFLDLSKAFDLVCYDKLWSKLNSLNVPGELINLLKFWYNNQNNCVRWAGIYSDTFKLECGVRQGGLTSPTLFNIYINGLIDELSSSNVGCSIDGVLVNNFSYADDMVLLGPSISAMRKLVSLCESYAVSHGLKYNVHKSELLVIHGTNKALSVIPTINLNGEPLKQVSQFKYLGHIITEDLMDDADIERERRALAVRCNMLARRFARCTDDVKITLFKAYCQSFYTCSLWVRYTQRVYNALRIQYNNAFRILLGLPRYCSASTMFAAAHTDDFYAIMRKRVASMMGRVRGSPNTIMRVMAEKPDSPILKHWVNTHLFTRCFMSKRMCV